MVTLELQGWWWAPEQPDNPVPGTLTFTEEGGLNLSLMGSLEEEKYPTEGSPMGQLLPLILGVVSGSEATLVDVVPRHRRFSAPGFNTVTYHVDTAYLGQHYDAIVDLAFSKVKLQFTHLEDWMAQVPVYSRHPSSEEWPKRHEVGFMQEEPISGAIRNGSVMLGHDVNMSEHALSATIQGTASMRIELAERLTASQWYRGYIQPIENLLSLAVGRSVHTTKLLVHTMNQKPSQLVEVVARPFVAERPADSLLREDSLLFTSKDMECGYGEMLTRWFAFHDEYRDILNLYFSIGRSPRMYLEHQFLSTVQALEGYHRRRFPGTELPDEEHAQRIEAILDTAPTQHRKWLEQKLAYSNELSLKRRLKCLTLFVGEPLVPWMPNAKKRESFVKRVVDARNVLTHYSPDHPQKALAGDTLFGMTEALSIMMQALLLREIGFSETTAMKLFEKYQTYGWAARRARDGS